MAIIDGSPAIIRSTFTANSVPGHGGGAMNIQDASDPIVINTSFIGNDGSEAGAIHTEDVEIGDSGGTFVNCLFSSNTSAFEGGAINPGGGGTLTFINCTFADNTVDQASGGGAIFTEFGTGPVILTNCILWKNLANNIPKQIEDSEDAVIVTYSDVQGGWACPPGMSNCGNIDADPLFVDPGSNYRLAADSPCIDVGNNADVPCDEFDVDEDGFNCVSNPPQDTPDLDLGDRIVDGDENMTATVDMGPYESVPCPWDLSGDCKVGAADLLVLLTQWGGPGSADFDGDGNVGAEDLLVMLVNWGPCPCDPLAEVLSLEEELADACLTMADWDAFVAVMTDPNASQADKDRYHCWMNHYLFHCNRCFCSHPSECPSPDPFG